MPSLCVALSFCFFFLGIGTHGQNKKSHPEYDLFRSFDPDDLPQPWDHIGWVLEIQDLVDTMRDTFGNMGSIASNDNPSFGPKIVSVLQDQLAQAVNISNEFAQSQGQEANEVAAPVQRTVVIPIIHQQTLLLPVHTPRSLFYTPHHHQFPPIRQLHNFGFGFHYRYKRQADGGGGAEAFDKVARVMTETPGKIASDQGKLSGDAQAQMDQEYVAGLKKCKSRECKSQLKVYLAGQG